MRRALTVVGFLALLVWTGLGLFAWSSAARRVTIDFAEDEARERDAAELLVLKDELTALRQDVRALATALGENLQALQDAVLAAQAEHAAAFEREVAALREAVPALELQPGAATSETTPAAPGPPSAPTSTAELSPTDAPSSPRTEGDPPAVPAGDGAKPRKSFLAFQLPSDDVRFDERRSWTVLPSLSRVGFDAKTTLHDFTATTSSVEGELEADLSHSDATPRASIRVRVATLDSGEAGRDEEMRRLLAVEQHATIEFELGRFEPGAIDAAALRASGTAHGRMTVRGVTQDVAMPVKLSIDDARRLLVEGEMTLDLTRFQVPLPNKLGLLTMEKDIRVWISLRLRANPRSRG